MRLGNDWVRLQLSRSAGAASHGAEKQTLSSSTQSMDRSALNTPQPLPALFGYHGIVHGGRRVDLDSPGIRLELLRQAILSWKLYRSTRKTQRLLRWTGACIRQDQEPPAKGKRDNVAAIGGTSQVITCDLWWVPKASHLGGYRRRDWMECRANVSFDVVAILIDRDEYLPLTYFDKIYIVDLCQPLLDVARERCRQKGWRHVEFLCQDASQFAIPEWESGQLDPRGSLTAITMSYSLSMVSGGRLFT